MSRIEGHACDHKSKAQIALERDRLLMQATSDQRNASRSQAESVRLLGLVKEVKKVLEDLLADPYLSQPLNDDRMAPARAVLNKINGG